jgi:hypothetical protein
MVYFSAITILTKLCVLKDILILSPSSLFLVLRIIPSPPQRSSLAWKGQEEIISEVITVENVTGRQERRREKLKVLTAPLPSHYLPFTSSAAACFYEVSGEETSLEVSTQLPFHFLFLHPFPGSLAFTFLPISNIHQIRFLEMDCGGMGIIQAVCFYV